MGPRNLDLTQLTSMPLDALREQMQTQLTGGQFDEPGCDIADTSIVELLPAWAREALRVL